MILIQLIDKGDNSQWNWNSLNQFRDKYNTLLLHWDNGEKNEQNLHDSLKATYITITGSFRTYSELKNYRQLL